MKRSKEIKATEMLFTDKRDWQALLKRYSEDKLVSKEVLSSALVVKAIVIEQGLITMQTRCGFLSHEISYN